MKPSGKDLRVRVNGRTFIVSWGDLERMLSQALTVEILDVI